MPVIKDAYIPDATNVTPVVQKTDDLKKMTEGIKAVNEIKNVAGAVSGLDAIQRELERKEKKMEEIEKEREQAKREAQETKMELIQKELGGKIEQLSQTIKSGASQKSISEQLTEVKKAAVDLGLGTSKVSEFKEMANLIQSLGPQQKGLAEQVKEAKELLAAMQPEKEKETHVERIPAEIALEMKKMETNLQVTLEQMKDERQRKDHEFQLTLKKWEEEKELRRQEIESKLMLEKERNELIGGGLERLGRVIAQATLETEIPSQSRKIAAIQAGEGEFGEVTCINPNCQATVPIARDAMKAICPGCGTTYNINRIKKEIPTEQVEGAEQSEPESGSAEEVDREFAD